MAWRECYNHTKSYTTGDTINRTKGVEVYLKGKIWELLRPLFLNGGMTTVKRDLTLILDGSTTIQ